MSDVEIASAWLRATKELKAIELEFAGLGSELRRTGGALVAAGTILADDPGNANKAGLDSLAEEIQVASKRARRLAELIGLRAGKKAEVDRFESAS
jgi:hypothetical protein